MDEFATPRHLIPKCSFRNKDLEGKAKIVLWKRVYTDVHQAE